MLVVSVGARKEQKGASKWAKKRRKMGGKAAFLVVELLQSTGARSGAKVRVLG